VSEVWLAIPTANAPQCAVTFADWKAMGYRTACLIDGATPIPDNADLVVRTPDYGGYGWAVNLLCRVLRDVPWVVTGGDDILPDLDHAPEAIARECEEHFNGTMGVMQPTGDPWNDNCISKCAGSPWMGREFRLRANLGLGPYCEDYRQYYDDTELMNVCQRAGIFWQRPDLTHTHEHWTKKKIPRPAYLEKAAAGHDRSKALFEKRRSEGFPGSGFLR
jgi:hypothetical protein